MGLGTDAAPAFARVEENQQISQSPDLAPKIARLAETLDITESEIRSSSVPENRLAELFNEYSNAFKSGVRMLTAATLLAVPTILGCAYLSSNGSKSSAIAVGITEAFLMAASIAYPETVNHRIKNEIKNAMPAPQHTIG